ncbi:MAG: hypothetical protein JO061_06005 [Acidobacteriaceae bacterium]|nr:hypothetical protein [Acidobacteriaceae bacterium]
MMMPAQSNVKATPERREFSRRLTALLAGSAAVVYLSLALFGAAQHRLWFDEVNTALLARLGPHRLWNALKAGADTNPPLLYLPVHLLYGWGIGPELATRLPAILEFGLMMIFLYLLARAYVPVLYALFACFAPFLTAAGIYATEGRGYAAMLGSSAAALFFWSEACRDRRRPLMLTALALSIAIGIGNHYSSTVILVSLFAGELTRLVQSHRIDWGVAIAVCAGALTLALFRPLLPAIHEYLKSYWGKPSIHELVFGVALGYGLGLALMIIFWALSRWRAQPNAIAFASPPPYERVAWIVLLCAPIQGYLQGLVTGGFTVRYAVDLAIPMAIFLAIYACRVGKGTPLFGAVLLAMALIFCAGRLCVRVFRPIPFEREADWIKAQASVSTGPIVIGSPLVFSPLYFYASEPLKRRIFYVSDPDLSTRILHQNSPDHNLHQLRDFSPMPVIDYSQLKETLPSFQLVNDDDSWLLTQLRRDGISVSRTRCDQSWCLYDVTF